ncbi:tetratricopeptide repeat protein [Chryseobacterium sp. RP-3-3]|uniref:Tetratricopeptide repeat protein n=1 Tax=Chryseobacterium antibioticum TaxID=2728847 RepID=A0A7Y0AR36_9FLAO|nr:tetratricopeptide repeat protein [Chryseobacterium antibioticum]NML71810.1 tetratricopeptide repeat protein [Chryseobacterium antibioticum]
MPDSLVIILNKTTDLSKRTEILNKISDSYKTSDPDAMQKYAQEALQSAKKTKNVKEEVLALQNLGTSNIILGNYNRALQYFDQAEQKISNLNKTDQSIQEISAKNFGSKGIIYSEQNNYSQALNNDFKAMKLYESCHNEVQLSKIYNNIGVIYHSIDDQEKALYYFLKSYTVQKKIKAASLGVSCSNIGLIYLDKNLPQKAKVFFDEGLSEFQKNPNSRELGELYNNMAQYYMVQKQFETAKDYLLKAEKAFKSTEDRFGLSNTYLFLGKIYYTENKLEQALEFANKSLEISKELDLPETTVKSEELLSQIFDKKGNKEQALIHLKNYNVENKNLTKIENAKERIRTELDFESERHEIEQKEKTNREKIKWYFGFLLLIIILAGIYFFFRNKEREKTILLQKQLTEFQHKALHLQMNPHFVFNCLAAISSFIMQNDKDEAIKYLAKFSKLMRLTLDFSKESLIAIDKEIESLKNYLELEQLRFNQKFEFKIIKDPLIEDDTALPSLLLQPYIENSVIHGVVPKEGQGLIQIHFSQTEESLICEITDNGIGIETSKKLKKNLVNVHTSMAMEISQKRLETLEKLEKKKVNLTITEIKGENNTSEGTKVVLELPLEYIKD